MNSSCLAVRSGFASKKRRYGTAEVVLPGHRESHHVLAVVVLPPVPIDRPASEEVSDGLKCPNTSFALNHDEPGLHLPTEPHLRARVDRAAEATFTIYEADYPSLES